MNTLTFDYGDGSPIFAILKNKGNKVTIEQIVLSEPGEQIKKYYAFGEMTNFQETEHLLNMERNTLKQLLRDIKIGYGWDSFAPYPQYIAHGLFMRCKHKTSSGKTAYLLRITPKGRALLCYLVKLLC